MLRGSSHAFGVKGSSHAFGIKWQRSMPSALRAAVNAFGVKGSSHAFGVKWQQSRLRCYEQWLCIKLGTPKALTNISPGLERSDNPGGKHQKSLKTLKAFASMNQFRQLAA
jgi:hypothetical protein